MNTTDFFQSQLKLKKKNQDICAYATRTKKRVEIDNISRFKIKKVWGIVLNEKMAEIFTSNVRKKNRLAASLAKETFRGRDKGKDRQTM